MKPDPQTVSPVRKRHHRSNLLRDILALACLLSTLFIFFPQLRQLATVTQVTGDSLTAFYPLFQYTAERLAEGRLALIADESYHGLPLAALRTNGLLCPPVLAILALKPFTLAYNLLYLLPFALSLLGAYFLGRTLRLSRPACLFLALLWTYNGTNMARVDGINIQWANGLFPWVLAFLQRHLRGKNDGFLLAAGFAWGCALWTGHPQLMLFQGIFLAFWLLLIPSRASAQSRLRSGAGLGLGALLWAAPFWMHGAEVLASGGGFGRWDDVNRFFHSWTPLNALTLVFPWFFGKSQLDGRQCDYWWQYHFNEMQAAFSIVGLFFILLFFLKRHPFRLFVASMTSFSILMALGRFTPVYPFLSSLPPFHWFRDPARWWFPAAWSLSLGAALAWDAWLKRPDGLKNARRLWPYLAGGMAAVVLLGNLLLGFGRPLLDAAGRWFIGHILAGDPLHRRPFWEYAARLPEKWAALAPNLDPTQPRVYLPFLFVVLLGLCVFLAGRRASRPWILLLLLAVTTWDLAFFRFPYGQSFGNPDALPGPLHPAPRNRMLSLVTSPDPPSPKKVSQMTLANFHFRTRTHALPAYLFPELSRYRELGALLGWFAWVDRTRDPAGFSHHPNLMRALGVDLVVSDSPFRVSPAFRSIHGSYPYAWRLSGTAPRARLVTHWRVSRWPELLRTMESRGYDPSREALLEQPVPGVIPLPAEKPSEPRVRIWEPAHLDLLIGCTHPSLLVLQKSFLTGWKARVNGKRAPILEADGVLMAVPVPAGASHAVLTYDPPGLRLGFFLSMFFAAWTAATFLRKFLRPVFLSKRA